LRSRELAAWLDSYLDVRGTPDAPVALNGLQVDNDDADVRRIAVAVDACQAVIESASALQADFLIVHHGLFWAGLEPLTGRAWRRVAGLLRSGTALYSAHLPLDRHAEVGNNVELARLLGMPVRGWWGEYKGTPIGVWGELDEDRDALGRRLGEVLRVTPRLLACGPGRSRRVGIVTGAGGDMIDAAHAAGIDTFITGEGKHHSFFDAEELGVNVFYAGHYATETLGVRALGARIETEFGVPWSFIDHPTGL
jgi:dinuclear metal center YbgI/SA1388 family protein